jgi:hypothetical protein
VLAKDGWTGAILPCVLGSQLAIRLDVLAAVMVEVAVKGVEESVLGNAEILKRGRELLARR